MTIGDYIVKNKSIDLIPLTEFLNSKKIPLPQFFKLNFDFQLGLWIEFLAIEGFSFCSNIVCKDENRRIYTVDIHLNAHFVTGVYSETNIESSYEAAIKYCLMPF